MNSPPKKKLIEVALPLDAINKASAREKSIRHGHPSTLHLWWARRPLAAARAVIFAQMVDDPSSHPDLFPTPKAQERERQRLFGIIEELVQWENSTNERVLSKARDAIWQSWRSTCAEMAGQPGSDGVFDRAKLPGFHDPFAGGGALPLEAQRLGLESFATDLNPVAVLINKALIEIPARFAGRSPVNQSSRGGMTAAGSWTGASGLVEDVRHYGEWVRSEAERRIGRLYPKTNVTPEMARNRPDLKPLVGEDLTVIAWIWARTVKSPNPAFAQVEVPLASTFYLSAKAGQEAWVEPVVEGNSYRFEVRSEKPADAAAVRRGTKAGGSHSAFLCLMSGAPMPFEYLRSESRAGRMGARLMAVIAEGARGRVFLPPTAEAEALAAEAKPTWKPELAICHWPGRTNVVEYGLTRFGDLFTPRQMVALSTFSALVEEVREVVRTDALRAGLPAGSEGLEVGGRTASAYADAVAVYLGLVVSSLADRMSTICTWDPGGATWGTKTRSTFSRQAIPMTWDFAEVNPFSTQSGSLANSIDYTTKGIAVTGTNCGSAAQADAASQETSRSKIISTDPPYYDNIGYADLSDFFYVWLRRSLKSVYPGLFATVAVPKAEELVATPGRHGGKEKAEAFFLDGMTKAMSRLAEQAIPGFPVTIYYAFKQAEREGTDGTSSTGWETFLDAVIRAGFAISGTWPVRTELSNRMVGAGSNALASSIVLVCRHKSREAPTATRREFIRALSAELPAALAHLQRGNIAPVDLAQAAIGPGMAVYTRYARVLDAEGHPLTVREALGLINQTLDEALAEQEGDFDADSRWAMTWFEQMGFEVGKYGDAEQLATARNTSVTGLVEAGIIDSGRGKVRLLKPGELPEAWDPSTDARLTSWEIVHHLIRALGSGGELGAAALVAKLDEKADAAREMAYRLFAMCERKKRPTEALAYNALVQSWPEVMRLARDGGGARSAKQKGLFDKDED